MLKNSGQEMVPKENGDLKLKENAFFYCISPLKRLYYS